MFVVKRLGKNGLWSAVSLIDMNGSFRGEAKFETQAQAEDYMADYLERMKSRRRTNLEGYGDVKVFDDSKQDETKANKPPAVKARKRKAPKRKKDIKNRTIL
jgi:hypothetical protein